MDLSIVTTLYCSAAHLEEFHARATAAALKITGDYEIVLVNDGSPDDSLDVALRLHEQDERVRIIDLARNFGHHKAMMTGLAHARGDLVFLLDSDLEEEPEILTRFHGEMRTSGADVVYGVQERRKGDALERWTGHVFYTIFNLLSSQPVPRDVLTARLMTKRYVSSLVEHRDKEVFLLGLWTITGFKQVPVPVQKHSCSTSSYTLRRKVAILVNSITSFSNRPLIAIFYLGCMISLTAALAAGYLVVRRLFFGILLAGWPSLIVSVWLLGGLTIFCLGIIGIYLSKVFMETKDRPYTVIRQRYERQRGGRP
jgi:putative glycosyltransferase